MTKRNGGKPTAVVAGGAGFVGYHLSSALLEAGHRVVCIDSFLTGTEENAADLCRHPDFRLLRHDVTDPIALGEPVDRVYNLACAASPPHYQADPGAYDADERARHSEPPDTRRGERRALRPGLDVARSTATPRSIPSTKATAATSTAPERRACYDEGKRAAEALVFDYLRARRVDVRVARIFNTYGPRMRADDGRIVSNMIVQALEGRPMTIYGTGEQTRSFCYVSDLVRGLLALAEVEAAPSGPVNLGNPAEFTVLELARLVRALVGSRSPIVHRPLPEDDPRRRRPDIGRAEALLGWRPRIGLDRGLPATVEWFASRSSGTVTEVRDDTAPKPRA
jgi:UDP-glucuronate decarboxylase